MLRELFFHYVPRLALVIVAAGMLVALPGCGGDDPDGVTASSSQYAPAGRDESPKAPSPAVGEDPSADAPQVAQEIPGRAPPAKTPPAGQDPLGGVQEPPPVSYEVPEGGPPELFAYVDRLNERLHALINQRNALEQQGQSSEAVVEEVKKNLNAQIAAADKILAANPDEDVRLEAVQNKARAIQAQFQMQFPGAEERLNAMIEELSADPDEDLQSAAVVYRLTIPLIKLQTGQLEDAEPLVTALATFLETAKKKDAAMFAVAVEAIRTLQMLGRMDEAIVAMRDVGETFQTSGEERVAVQALALAQQAGQYLEFTGRVDEAKEVYDALAETVAALENPEVKQQLEEALSNAQKRVGLVGQEVAVENMVNLAGEPIDWSNYKGKVVLLDFWATWCGPCIEEIPNIAEVYATYKDEGFEVIGVNLDDNIEDVQKFFEDEQLAWTIAIPADPEQRGFENPLAQKFGVDAIPFMLLVDQEGKVAAIHTRGPRLEQEVRRLLNIQGEKTPAEGDTPPAVKEKPADELPKEKEGEAPAKVEASDDAELDLPLKPANEGAVREEKKPGDGDSGALVDAHVFFVAFQEDEADDDEAASTEATPARNPYLADEGLSTLELVEYLLDMQDKPRVIQQRPGFAEAIAEAADRVLAAEDAKEKYQVLAALAKIKHLHDRASFGDEKCDAALAAFVEKMEDDPRDKIAAEVKFLQLERRALEADKLDAAQIDELLAELKAYFEEHRETLSAKHLRMASAAVGAINQIEDGDTREKHFNAFGSLFAASDDRELARYGKQLSAEAPASSLVGKTLELSGATELGTPLDWEAYRGKVVVVDFWAAWCGPCRRATPAVKAFHEQHRDAAFDVVGVNLDRDQEALTQYLDEHKLPWTNIVGKDAGELAKKCGVRGIPTFVLVGRHGKVLEVGHSFEAMQEKIEELLKTS
ncbi:MAG: redoxin family protein [Planctomycetes bacterium]|nr:redoxin family protein [Planctomycetota bacterium]